MRYNQLVLSVSCKTQKMHAIDRVKGIELEEFLSLTPYKLSKLTGVDASNWFRWLNGKTEPSAMTLLECAKELGMSLDILMLGIQMRIKESKGDENV
jgi:transcriptional regulator with XRE-family HTH domain